MDAELHPNDAYPAHCTALLGSRFPSLRAHVLGRAGETSGDALLRIDRELLPLRTEAAVVAFGSNDFYVHGYATASRVTLERFEHNIRLICEKLLGTQTHPIILGLPPLIDERFAAFSAPRLYFQFGSASGANRAYDAVLRKVATELGVVFVPVAWDSTLQADYLGLDGEHPTPAGHADIAARLVPVIDSLLSANPPISKRAMEKPALFPNPFSLSAHGVFITRIRLDSTTAVRWILLDASGARVREVFYENAAPGVHYVLWDGRDDKGALVSPGIFSVRIAGPLDYRSCIIVQ